MAYFSRTPLSHPLLVIALLLAAAAARAQPLTDGFSKAKGTGDIVVSYSWERYDEFYFAAEKRAAPPPFGGQITTQSVSLYGVYGITDDLNAIVSLPFIAAKGDATAGAPQPENGGAFPDQSVSGLQDIELLLKYRFVHAQTESGTFSALAAASFAGPVSDYDADAVLSIGSHAPNGNLYVIGHYLSPQGIFGEVQAGYSLRGNDRSGEVGVDVPNATLLSAKVGYAAEKFYVDLWSRTQISDSGAIDIGDGAFNATRVNFTQIGVSGYVPIRAGFGLSAGFARYLTGRNVGLATRVSAGVVYAF